MSETLEALKKKDWLHFQEQQLVYAKEFGFIDWFEFFKRWKELHNVFTR